MKKNPLTSKLLGRRKTPPLADLIPEVDDWFSSKTGQHIVRQEQGSIDTFLEKLFGYHLLQLSVCQNLELHKSSKVNHKFIMSPIKGGNAVALSEDSVLPIESEAVDVVLLHHVLEYSEHPHELLKEASRIALPSGHIIIVGFNPFSFLGLWSLIGRLRNKNAVWKNHMLSTKRLADWLTLMDFSVQAINFGAYLPPSNKAQTNNFLSSINNGLQRLQAPFGGYYVVLAKKETSRLTPIKSHWKKGQKMIPVMESSLYASKKNKKTLH